MGDLFPSIRLVTLVGRLVRAGRRTGLGIQLYSCDETEYNEETDLQALRKAWRKMMADPTSYNWYRKEEVWRKDVTTAEAGGDGAVKKILVARMTKFRWAEAPDHEETLDSNGNESSGSGENLPIRNTK